MRQDEVTSPRGRSLAQTPTDKLLDMQSCFRSIMGDLRSQAAEDGGAPHTRKSVMELLDRTRSKLCDCSVKEAEVVDAVLALQISLTQMYVEARA